MSSFIVDEKTMHRILTHIDTHKDRFAFGCACRQLRIMGFDLSARSGLDAVGSALYALNYQATNERYGLQDAPDAYVYEYERCSDHQALKSLQCLMYQCTEGDVPETPLYRWLELYQRALLMHIVDAMPEYITAEWG